MSEQSKNKGYGCASIPISVVLLIIGGSIWSLKKLDLFSLDVNKINTLLGKIPAIELAIPTKEPPVAPSTVPTPTPSLPLPTNSVLKPPVPPAKSSSEVKPSLAKTNWEKKQLRGIYLSRYQITNNASEQTIRDRVRYYKSQGINTIIHGVWGNACTMYPSEVMEQTLGYSSCPNKFKAQWLDWLIDEAHQQGMEVYGYFEKGIKIDRQSPVFDSIRAVSRVRLTLIR